MTAILRNNAVSSSVSEARLGKGGSGRAPLVVPKGSVKRRLAPPDDPAAELMPAAEFLGHETDFAAILEEFRDSPFDPAKRRVLGKLMGMFAMDYQGAQPEERRFLRRLLLAGNPREGYVANRALHLCGASPIVRRTLALGVAEARFATGRPQGFVGAVQARVAATTFRLLGPESREAVWNLLVRAGQDAAGRPLPGAERVLERALVLKALAARRHRLGPWSVTGAAALAELQTFAAELRGNSRAALAARTTLSPGDPARVAPRLARLRDQAERAGYLARGEVDPLFAWQEHGRPTETAAGRAEVTANRGGADGAADEALPDLDRHLLLDRPRLHWALAEARAHAAHLSADQAEALTDWIVGRTLRAERLVEKDEALALLASRGFDVARPEAVDAIRQDAQGVYRFDAARALGDLLSRFTGATYVRRVFSDQTTAGLDPVGQITTAIARGFVVPVLVGEMRLPVWRAFAAAAVESDDAERIILSDPVSSLELAVSARQLQGGVLPTEFGQKARADAFLAPAALDLLAPPFGLSFPELGIEDRL